MSRGYLAKCSTGGKPKTRHETQAAAESHRRYLIWTGRWTAGGSNTYWCNQCGGYHAGSTGRFNRGGGKRSAKNIPRHLATQ